MKKSSTVRLLFLLLLAGAIPPLFAYCVYNNGCKAAHAELYQRNQGPFSDEFSKKIPVGKRECCDPKSSGCVRGSKEDLLLWIDCDTESRDKKGYGQTVVVCGECTVSIRDNGMITVDETGGRTRAIYACKGIEAALCPADTRDRGL